MLHLKYEKKLLDFLGNILTHEFLLESKFSFSEGLGELILELIIVSSLEQEGHNLLLYLLEII